MSCTIDCVLTPQIFYDPQKQREEETATGGSSEDAVWWLGRCCGVCERVVSLLFIWVESSGWFDEQSQSRTSMSFPKQNLPCMSFGLPESWLSDAKTVPARHFLSSFGQQTFWMCNFSVAIQVVYTQYWLVNGQRVFSPVLPLAFKIEIWSLLSERSGGRSGFYFYLLTDPLDPFRYVPQSLWEGLTCSGASELLIRIPTPVIETLLQSN